MRYRKKRADSKPLKPSLACFRSSITNGSALLHDVDGRSATMRRLRDIVQAHVSDLGGPALLSEGQTALLRRAALLQLQTEMLETKFAANEGAASREELETYQRISNTLRRLLESLNLHTGRKARDVTPPSLTIHHLIDDVLKRQARTL
jgi:hypothetical protein